MSVNNKLGSMSSIIKGFGIVLFIRMISPTLWFILFIIAL
jgi:hypothetical protein